jgi:hypothetical protein
MQLVSKVSFFYSVDLRTRYPRAANFPSRKKSITLLTCCINNYFLFITFYNIVSKINNIEFLTILLLQENYILAPGQNFCV